MIKTSKVSTEFMNSGKQEKLALFLAEYRNAVSWYVKFYWSQNFSSPSCLWQADKLKKHKFYPYKLEFKSLLSGRSLKCAQTQAMGIIDAAIAKQRQRVYQLSVLMREGKDTRRLQKAIHLAKISKPKVPANLSAELNSVVLSMDHSSTSFDIAFTFSSLFNKETARQFGGNKFVVLANKHHHFNGLIKEGAPLSSFLVSKDSIDVRFDLPEPQKKQAGSTLGIDQGVTTCLSVKSNDGSEVTSRECPHGHDLTSILQKLSRKTKGSNAFRRAQAHRKNYINWCINQLDLTNTKELRLEHLHQVGKGQRKSRFLSHWSYAQITAKLQDRCTQEGVLFVLSTNEYRSQRCSSCGFVHKANRKGKTFICRSCGEIHDADINAASNHLVDLPEIQRSFVGGLNRTTGFHWNPEFDGVYSPIDQAIVKTSIT